MLMTKTVHPVLKKTGAVLLTVLVLVLMAVSYTHLDVYKRQKLLHANDLFNGVYAVLYFFTEGLCHALTACLLYTSIWRTNLCRSHT